MASNEKIQLGCELVSSSQVASIGKIAKRPQAGCHQEEEATREDEGQEATAPVTLARVIGGHVRFRSITPPPSQMSEWWGAAAHRPSRAFL